ncbi:hypothetical protein F2Q70_00025362 [Brassica cretica]|uniref:Cysteinyl-tRNA synthetase class Ia DALR domain-containing protein n=1 Tax=Brassica cretica TaxID=69181 RepID=A0A8S9L735_BRACR|nr:hypothetical protein F2Q70_00025362 [Brassica cretica]
MASLLNLFKSCRPFTPIGLPSRLRIQFPLRPGKLTQPRRSFTPHSSSSSPSPSHASTKPSVKDLWLHNTMSRKKELFKPKVEGQVGMYVCGVTAYDLSHIGHARVYVTFDVLFSPWGRGRPGWHIECSAMSAAYLGYSFDIHGGGMDLVFPHHENEIAQSCAACDSSDISYWIHNGFVTVDSEKMSKSLGNFFTIRQVIDLYHPLALRLFLMGTHYRSPINYSDFLLESASERVFYIYQTLHDCESVLGEKASTFDNGSVPSDTLTSINTFRSEFIASMSDDLLTPVTLAAMSEPLKTINDLIHTRKGKKQPRREESLKALEASVREVLTILGLMPTSYSEVLEQLKEKALKRAGLNEEDVLQRVKERTDARKNKEYERSDEIRKELANVGIALMDSPEGTAWRPAIPLALQEPSTTT